MAVSIDPPADRGADFGPRMKRMREERGVPLRRIAEATKISVGVLEALERNDISRLPGGIFSRGLVRAYAEQIGADPDVVVRDFVARFPHNAVADGGPHAAASHAGGTGVSAAAVLAVLGIAILLAAAALAAWWFLLRT
jgi:cytoskeletal protein RodZ